ncbi:hypothetical protein MANES_01G129050v8 [Manihot esculenta]|uniref:Uncharacterized protein n=1 Tax=Manihot esculenta TaxID=3983 RepID=A0ACB7ICI0_MANES|nr:hypothetical protein MANES_01G129050v8 [Manihot esculenta]
MSERKKKAPTLVDLCVDGAIGNVMFLGDVGDTDSHLLDRILPHCTVDNLSPVTDKLWKRFYELEFGVANANFVTERMKRCKASCPWRDLYEAKLKLIAKQREVARFRQPHIEQVRFCSKFPSPGSKRNFYGGSGPGYNLSSFQCEGQVDEEIKNGVSLTVDAATSSIYSSKLVSYNPNTREVKNIAAMKKMSMQRNNSSCHSASCSTAGGFPGNNSALSSRHNKSFDRRF